MSKPREKTREEWTAEIENGNKQIRHFEIAGDSWAMPQTPHTL